MATPRAASTDVTRESVEAFLARGGQIEKLPIGARGTPLLRDARAFQLRKDTGSGTS